MSALYVLGPGYERGTSLVCASFSGSDYERVRLYRSLVENERSGLLGMFGASTWKQTMSADVLAEMFGYPLQKFASLSMAAAVAAEEI